MNERSDRADGPDALLDVRHLRTCLPTSRGWLHAVDDASFRVDRGQTVGIVGESGSGKSMLARSIMGITPQGARTDGAAILAGRDLTAVSARDARAIWGHQVAMVFQNPMTSLNPVMRIGRQITEPLHVHLGMSKGAARERAAELLRMVGVPEPVRRLRAYPQELSGGMRQRVSIAIAIACSPLLLLADEPTTALDVTIQRQILDLLGQLQRDNGMAMVLITHDLGVVAGRTSHVLVMYGGRVVESGPTAALFDAPCHPYTASLLAAIPRLERDSHTKLAAIPGRATDVVNPRPGCRFASRCERADARCHTENPPFSDASPPMNHTYACFHPVRTTHRHSAAGVPVRLRARGGDDGR